MPSRLKPAFSSARLEPMLCTYAAAKTLRISVSSNSSVQNKPIASLIIPRPQNSSARQNPISAVKRCTFSILKAEMLPTALSSRRIARARHGSSPTAIRPLMKSSASAAVYGKGSPSRRLFCTRLLFMMCARSAASESCHFLRLIILHPFLRCRRADLPSCKSTVHPEHAPFSSIIIDATRKGNAVSLGICVKSATDVFFSVDNSVDTDILACIF